MPAADVEILSPRRRADELVMLELRLSRGLRFDDYAARTGFDARSLYANQIERLCALGLLKANDAGFGLTEQGLNVADAVAAEFFTADL